MIGCGTLATEVVRPGMMCGLCVPCGVADDRGYTAVYRQSGGARGVRAGVVERGRCDQPGEGGFKLLQAMPMAGPSL
jgi:hypothetical protein